MDLSVNVEASFPKIAVAGNSDEKKSSSYKFSFCTSMIAAFLPIFDGSAVQQL